MSTLIIDAMVTPEDLLKIPDAVSYELARSHRIWPSKSFHPGIWRMKSRRKSPSI
jgi:hypothetical protein